MTDSIYRFEETFQSYKAASLQQPGNLVASLALPFTRLKRAEMYEKIAQRFETHPDLKALPRYADLFRATGRGGQCSQQVLVSPASLPMLQWDPEVFWR